MVGSTSDEAGLSETGDHGLVRTPYRPVARL